MKAPFPRTLNHRLRSLGLLAALLFCFAPSVYANPAIIPGKAQNSVLAMYVAAAIFLEAVCVAWLLRRFRRPRFFVLWILGTHLLTFPVFLCAVWLLQPVFRDFTIALAEGLVVLAEGWLICQICRRVPSPTHLAPPTMGECWFVALIASAWSLLAFWLLLVPFTALFW
ncbi:MAG: hypothetical protein ACLQAH_19080 [Limisphaerales bacterium]